MKKPKPKTCRVCKVEFQPQNSIQKVCSMGCAIEYGEADVKAKRKRVERAATALKRKSNREAKAKAKKLSTWLAEAQTACNAYIRERDKQKGYGCISCGTKKPTTQYCAGHYRSRGAAPELRFNRLNIHLQCNKNCNLEKSGNITEYRIRLKERIGQKAIDWLEGPHQPQHYTVEDAKEIKQYYKEQLKLLRGKS